MAEDEPTDGMEINEQLALIAGFSAGGKSASLRNINNQDKWVYLNTESGKRLPFKNGFLSKKISDPWEVYDYFDEAILHKDALNGIVIDSITFLMDMFESQYVIPSTNTQKAWGDFAQFYKNLMQKKVVEFGKPVIIIGHHKQELNESTHTMETSVPIKGALRNNGVEAYFSTVVSAKRMTLKDLEGYENDLLKITDEDEEIGYKYVFQTRPTKATIGERIRSPMGMFSKNETFMDNDAQLLLDRLKEYYGS